MIPRVSVVTPTYNMVDRLPRCVDSVAAQTWRDIEHIVIDGGSSDGTVDYLRTQPHLKWVSEKDSGQSNALNKGFAMASGQILTWLNADDSLSQRAAEIAATTLTKAASLDLIYGDIEVVRGWHHRIVKPPATISLGSFRRGNVISQPGTFFTARALEAAGGIDESFHLTMDFELWLRMMMVGVQARYEPEVLASFEIHGDSKTGSRATLAFAQEEQRAFLKQGWHQEAAMTIDRWFWNDTLDQIVDALEAGEPSRAREVASAALPNLHPVLSRTRAFLWATRWTPGLAHLIVPLKRHRQAESGSNEATTRLTCRGKGSTRRAE